VLELPRLLNFHAVTVAQQLDDHAPRGPAGLEGCSRERTCQAMGTLRAAADFAGFVPWRATSCV